MGNSGLIDGDLGTNDGGVFRLGKGVVTTDGYRIEADKVRIAAGTSVFDVFANTLHTGNGASIN